MKNCIRFAALLSSCLLTGAAMIACNSEKAAPNVLAKVDKRIITATDFRRKLMEYSSSQNNIAVDESVRNKALNDLIEQELILIEAEARNLMITPAELESEVQRVTENYPGKEFEKILITKHLTPTEWREELKRNLLLKKGFNRITETNNNITDQQINDYYEKNKDKYQLPEQVHALHILVDSEQDAFDIMAQLRKGTPFETVAREYSLGPEAQSGGDLGHFAKGVMPEIFDEAIFSLDVGKISRVVHSEYGYHLFKLIDRTNPRQRSLDEVKEEIRNKLYEDERQKIYSVWLEQRLKKTRIMKNQELLARLNF